MFLIDAGAPPDPPRRRREPWLVSLVLDHVPWPALVVWLLAAALMTDGWVGVLCSWAAVIVAFWRMSRAFGGVGTMRDYVQ